MIEALPVLINSPKSFLVYELVWLITKRSLAIFSKMAKVKAAIDMKARRLKFVRRPKVLNSAMPACCGT